MSRVRGTPAGLRPGAACTGAPAPLLALLPLIPALLLGPCSAAAGTAIGHGEDIDWPTSPLDLNLRGLNGQRFRFRCPAGKPARGQVVGSGPYTDGSSICAAAVHAGHLTPAGGPVTIEVRPGQSHYVASLSHRVQSEAHERYWSGSFLILAEADQAPQASKSPATAPPDKN